MRVDLRKGATILLLFLAGLMIMWLGFSGRFGLFAAAILTPEYLQVQSSNNGGSNGSGNNGNG